MSPIAAILGFAVGAELLAVSKCPWCSQAVIDEYIVGVVHNISEIFPPPLRSCVDQQEGGECQVCQEKSLSCVGECYGGVCVANKQTTEKQS